MRRLADRVDIRVSEDLWPSLVSAAGFPAMRARAGQLVPDLAGVLMDSGAFFRRGSPGAGREALSGEQLTRYHARMAELAPADLLAWLNQGDR
jgi:hypothetical protein